MSGRGNATLEIYGLRAAYVKKDILHGVDISVRPGEIVSVIGANGSGKSTLLSAIAGQIPKATGIVRLQGVSLLGLPTHEIAAVGVRFLFQTGAIFPSLTVDDNLAVAGIDPGVAGDVFAISPRLRALRQRRAGLLSGGEMRILALALVLRPGARLLLLDEPSAGIAGGLAHHLLGAVLQWAAGQQASVLLVEQNLRVVASFAARVYTLTNGLATEVPSSDISDPARLARRILAVTPNTLCERSPS